MGKVCELFITHIAINWFGCGYNGCLRVSIGCVEREGALFGFRAQENGSQSSRFLSFLLDFKQRYPFEGKVALLPIVPAQNRQR